MSEPNLDEKLAAAIDACDVFEASAAEGDIPASAIATAILGRELGLTNPGRLHVRRATISGSLNLEGCQVDVPLTFEECVFPDPVRLNRLKAPDLRLIECVFEQPLTIDQAEIRWNLDLTGSTAAHGIAAREARLGGNLVARGAKVTGSSSEDIPIAFDGDRIHVGASAYFHELHADGELSLLGAEIGGQLSLVGAVLEAAKGGVSALSADGIIVAGAAVFNDLRSKGDLRLIGAEIGSVVDLCGAKLEGARHDEETLPSLRADRAKIGGSVICKEGFEAKGPIQLVRARIGGQLSMDEARVLGEILLLGASVSGEFGLLGAVLDGDGRPALSADRVTVGGGIYCGGLRANGEVRLLGAKIDAQILASGIELDGKNGVGVPGTALNAEGISVRGGVKCNSATSAGTLDFTNAEIHGPLSLQWARAKAIGDNVDAVRLVGTSASDLILSFSSVQGTVDLRNARVATLWDATDGELVGEQPSELRLEGFSYQTLAVPLDAKRRLAWIAPSQRGRHYPGVYVELSNAFRRIGHRGDARQVAIEGERKAIRQLKAWRARWLWNKLLWITTGSGYRNWLAGIWLLGLLVAGSLVFWHCEGTFQPISTGKPDFNPILYAVDVTIPVIEMGQQRAWAASGWLRWASLFLTISGYALATAAIAAATGLLNRDQRA